MLPLVLAAALLAVDLEDGPFSELSYDAALEQARTAGKLLLVDFTASWCQPCKRMEKETWQKEEVGAWLRQHAIAIQVDVDEQPDLAKRFAVEAMPTVVAVRDGQEFDRIVGYRDAAGFLGWGRDVLAGKRSSDDLQERSKALQESDDVRARYDLAQDLYRARQYEDALAHYLWLWPASRGASGMGGVRLSFMLREMAELARKHEPAKKAFYAILEALQVEVDGAEVPEFQDWQEWSSMCDYFGERSRMIAWYEKRRDDQGRLFHGHAAELVRDQIIERVFVVLMEAKRPADAVRLYEDARQRARNCVAHHEKMKGANLALPDEDARKQLEDFNRRKLSSDMASLYAALLASDRADEAADVAGLLLQTLDLPDSRLALVRAGLDVANRADPAFGRWLDEAEAAGSSVRILRKRLAQLEQPADPSGGK